LAYRDTGPGLGFMFRVKGEIGRDGRRGQEQTLTSFHEKQPVKKSAATATKNKRAKPLKMNPHRLWLLLKKDKSKREKFKETEI